MQKIAQLMSIQQRRKPLEGWKHLLREKVTFLVSVKAGRAEKQQVLRQAPGLHLSGMTRNR